MRAGFYNRTAGETGTHQLVDLRRGMSFEHVVLNDDVGLERGVTDLGVGHAPEDSVRNTGDGLGALDTEQMNGR